MDRACGRMDEGDSRMKFDFYTRNAAAQNSREANLRESTRMCSIAYGLSRLGHNVRIVNAPDCLMESPRWGFFNGLHGKEIDGMKVHPAETMQGNIGIKCSIGTANDEAFLSKFDLVVAHEYNERFESHRKLLKVPFLIDDGVMSGLVNAGLYDAYLDNNIERIRSAFPWTPNGKVGFCGKGWRNRAEALADAPWWADVQTYDTPVMSGIEHMRWITQYSGGLCLPGDTPKTRLPPLLALLGVPIIMWPISRFDTPPISDYNAILFESWEQVRSELDDEFRVSGIREYATANYLDSWSPMGQARLIAEFVE